uniref:Uncharacterized protein n=1 Tax=Arundo donax TaxID=35708 RepID=A0A0A9HIQ8_ARUDO
MTRAYQVVSLIIALHLVNFLTEN